MAMSRVFIVQNVRMRNKTTNLFEDKYNFNKAMKYGNVEVILSSDKNSPLSPGYCISTLEKVLKDFSDDDYLVPVGNPAFVAAAGAIASRNNEGRFKVLVWDKNQGSYIVSPIHIKQGD